MARTPLHTTYPSRTTRAVTSVLARTIGREPDAANIGVLAAALSSRVTPELFWGPAGSGKSLHALGVPYASPATDQELADELWEVSERLTEVSFL